MKVGVEMIYIKSDKVLPITPILTRYSNVSINHEVCKSCSHLIYIIGNLVVFTVQFVLSNSYQHAVILQNMPPQSNSSIRIVTAGTNLARSSVCYGLITQNHTLEFHDTVKPSTDNTCVLSGAYVSA